MAFKFACLFALVAFVCVNYVDSAPKQKGLSDFSNDDLAEKFAEFLQQDKEMANFLEFYKNVDVHSLTKRQAEQLDDDDLVTQRAEGFMDRAAKFVLELVQRFLKWINTD